MKSKVLPKNLVIIHLILLIIFIVFSIVFLTNFVKAVQFYVYDKNCDWKEETATIVKYSINTQNGQGYFYDFSTFYEYIDNNGKIYSGIWERFDTEADAKAEIGKQVTIYVDHERGIHKSSAGTNIGAVCFNGIIGFVTLPLFLYCLIRLLLHLVAWYKEKTTSQEE